MAKPTKASSAPPRPRKRNAATTNQATSHNKNTNSDDALAEPAAKRHRGARNAQAGDQGPVVNADDDVDAEELTEPEKETSARGANNDEMDRLKGELLMVIIAVHGLTLFP
jgi:hypothetical protein